MGLVPWDEQVLMTRLITPLICFPAVYWCQGWRWCGVRHGSLQWHAVVSRRQLLQQLIIRRYNLKRISAVFQILIRTLNMEHICSLPDDVQRFVDVPSFCSLNCSSVICVPRWRMYSYFKTLLVTAVCYIVYIGSLSPLSSCMSTENARRKLTE
jgi:hypothetical protein